MSDREIAIKHGITRSSITHRRNKIGIKKNSTGRTGELLVISKLESLGYNVEDLNSKNANSSYDLLVNNSIRIEVKSASKSNNGAYRFQLCNKKDAQVKNNVDIVTLTGRTRKKYHLVCDYIIFCIIENNDYYIVPINELPLDIQTVAIHPNGRRYEKYKNKFELLHGGDLVVG